MITALYYKSFCIVLPLHIYLFPPEPYVPYTFEVSAATHAGEGDVNIITDFTEEGSKCTCTMRFAHFVLQTRQMLRYVRIYMPIWLWARCWLHVNSFKFSLATDYSDFLLAIFKGHLIYCLGRLVCTVFIFTVSVQIYYMSLHTYHLPYSSWCASKY